MITRNINDDNTLSYLFNKKTGKLEKELGEIWNLIYPVGAVYISASETSPAELFGGTWEQVQDRFLLAAGETYEAGDTGGQAEYVAADMPAHTHTRGTMEIEGEWWTSWNNPVRGFHNLTCTGAFHNVIDTSRPGRITSEDGSASNSQTNGMPQFLASGGWTGETSQSGDNETATILPPYLAVYMWVRTE